MPENQPGRVYFENSQPILRVDNIPASLRFYVDQLGFENVKWGTDEFTCISRDRAAIYLCKKEQGRGGAWVWIGVDDVKRLHEEFKARGVGIRLPPTSRPWAVEMQVEDLDGNVLRFGSEVR
jgi:catechol 2,3-dioxygenase-like lactoylglutathione lyase family enzyme